MLALIGQALWSLSLPSTHLRDCPSDDKIPFESRSFDTEMQTSVSTSISNSDAKQLLAKEIPLVQKPAGQVLWYDFRGPNCRNANVTFVCRAKIQSLFLRERAKNSSP